MKNMEYANTYVEIDLDAIEANFRAVLTRAGGPVMAVVKADAYGHGAVPVAKTLEPLCAFFGVSSVAEALELHQAGLQKPILILGHTPPETYETVVTHGFRVAIFNWEDAKKLSDIAQAQRAVAYVHFALDTGMSRIGFQITEENADLCARIAQLPGLKIEGLFSHFATADETDLIKARAQAEKYAAFDRMLKERNMEIPVRHLDNSAGIMNFTCQYDMARAGIVIYGLYPSDKVDPNLLKLKPAMSWYSRVSHVKVLEAGRELSYGGTYKTTKETVVATVPTGYADGYRRSLSNRFYVLIRGQKAPILGRVCMDQFMVDVTDIPGVTPGDRVVLMGTDGENTISAETIGAAANSFNYEQVCDVSRRVTRVYIRGGKEVFRKNYLIDEV
jgi:alanine racemase